MEQGIARFAKDVGCKSARDAVLGSSITSHCFSETNSIKDRSVAERRFFEQGCCEKCEPRKVFD